jgi:glycosyltransferase involved in cell wall biosynthesis
LDEEGIVEFDHDAMRSAWVRWWNGAAHSLAPLEGRLRGIGRLRRNLFPVVADPLRWWSIRRGREDFDHPSTAHLLEITRHSPDVVHAHNLHWSWPPGYGYFDLRTLPALSHSCPFFLTLQDAWLLSGHCAHSFDCERWATGCGNCPDLSIYPSIARDATAFNWRRKRDIYARSRLRVATPSRWLMNKVERSILAGGISEARVIPNGVDTSVFRPADMAAARRELDLPADTPIALAAANGFRRNRFKDAAAMQSAIEAAADGSILFLAVGEDAPEERHGQATVRFIPPQEHSKMARFYQAADVYLHAARADTSPIAIAEALACGTPVVATAVGGIPELVTHGQTGFLAPLGDVAGLATALRTLLTDEPLRSAMGAAAAAEAGPRLDFSRVADAYLDWYTEALSEEHAKTIARRTYGRRTSRVGAA